MNKIIKFSLLSLVGLLMFSNNLKEDYKDMNIEKNIEKKVLNILSSNENKEHIAMNANDNDFNTYWMSDEKENQSLEIDLLEPKLINNVTQIFVDEDIWYFKIEGSYDKNNYFELYDGSFGDFGRTFSTSTNAVCRYVRLTIIKSMKGFNPSSKEFYIDYKDLSEGTNVALGALGSASSYSGTYTPSKAFDGNYGTFYCASNESYPQHINVNLSTLCYVKNVNLHFQDYGIYDFELKGILENDEEITLINRSSLQGISHNVSIEKELKGFIYKVYSGPGWANLKEMEVNGFKNIVSDLDIKTETDLKSISYINRVKSNNTLYGSIDGINYELINDNSNINKIYRYIKGLNSDDIVYGYNIYKSLSNGFSGIVSSYLDEEHHITKATLSSSSSYYSSKNNGEEEFILLDLGRASNVVKVIQEFNVSDTYKFKLEASLDNKNYDLIVDNSSGINGKYFEFEFKENSIYRYIKLSISCLENQYFTSKRFEVIGNGSSVRENWWERESGVIRFYPKEQRVTLREITDRLDEFRYSGYKVIELHQPYEGLADIWAGLGGTNNYQVDPIIGTLDDLRYLLDEAHKRGMYIFMFGNVGYGKYNSDYFKKACKDYALGIDSRERNWFLFSDTCIDPSKWFYSDTAGAYYYGYWGENGKIPTFNFNNPEWQEETKRYINFWATFGMDGIALDAPNVYYFGSSNASEITYETITNTMRKNNLFSLPEGSGDTSFISAYHYSGVQNYNVSSWGGGAYSLGIDSARKNRATTIDDNIKPYRDIAVALGGISIAGMNFEDNYLDASMKERELEAALVTSTGHLAFLHLGSSARIGQDIMKEWDNDTLVKVARSFSLQNSIGALSPTGARFKVSTSNDDKFYSFIKTDMSGKNKVIPVFNYSNKEEQVQINMNNTGIQNGTLRMYDAYNDEQLDIVVVNGVMRVPMKSLSYRLLMMR